MNLKSVNDTELIKRAENLVREERELLTTILHHLREIDRRLLFSSQGYRSLFDFAVRKLGYSEDQAYRRISAMKLLKEIPEIEEKINQGQLTLTHIRIASSMFRREKKIHKNEMSPKQKTSVLMQIANKSSREAERITLALSSAQVAAKPDRVKLVSESHIEIKLTASVELQDKIERLKGRLAHKYPNLALGELFEMLCDLGLKEWNQGKTAAHRKLRVNFNKSRAQIRREVFQRANNQCENCKSTYALEIDHIQPRAMGGLSQIENLRVLCRSCNQRAAIKAFGLSKMEQFLES